VNGWRQGAHDLLSILYDNSGKRCSDVAMLRMHIEMRGGM